MTNKPPYLDFACRCGCGDEITIFAPDESDPTVGMTFYDVEGLKSCASLPVDEFVTMVTEDEGLIEVEQESGLISIELSEEDAAAAIAFVTQPVMVR